MAESAEVIQTYGSWVHAGTAVVSAFLGCALALIPVIWKLATSLSNLHTGQLLAAQRHEALDRRLTDQGKKLQKMHELSDRVRELELRNEITPPARN